jgi:uncharacterized membrane protein
MDYSEAKETLTLLATLGVMAFGISIMVGQSHAFAKGVKKVIANTAEWILLLPLRILKWFFKTVFGKKKKKKRKK